MRTTEEQRDRFARLGCGHAGAGMVPVPRSALDDFDALDVETQDLVLRILDNFGDREEWELDQHADGRAISAWLLTLPRYQALDAARSSSAVR